jgi:hypothetical protein
MAVCHEKEGRTATAWVEFRDAEALARRDGRDDRVTLAAERQRALEPRLLRLRIVLPSEADAPGLAIALDGADLPRPAWVAPLPVDPGEHVLEVSAPSRVAHQQSVTVTTEGETRDVVIERLDVPPPAPVAVPAPSAVPSAAPPSAPAPSAPLATALVPQDRAAPHGLGAQRITALAVGGAGVVGLVAGAYLGLDAFSKHSQAIGQCPAPDACSAQGVTYNDESKMSADRSTVAFGASVVLLGAAVYLWLSAPENADVHVVPVAGGRGRLVAVRF